ncbi:MAG: hypothetical protein WCC57_07385, partial [Paracoccaceae bacterium]
GRSEDGTILVEAVLVMPTLVWVTLAMFVFWDGYRSKNIIQKATYTISDAISRIETDIDGNYINGLLGVMNYLLDDSQQAKMRVTSVTYKEADDDYQILWSYSPGNNITPLAQGVLAVPAFQAKIPNLADGDTVVVVETQVDFEPAFDVGMADLTIENFIVTRPRSGRVCFVAIACF